MPARSCLSKALGCSLLLLFCLSCCGRAWAAATATLTVSGAETQLAGGWDQGNLTVAFNGFTETVHYAQFSSSASLASALAMMFSRDYIGSGLCAHASGAAVTFQLQGTATFGQLAIAGPTTSFQLSGLGFSSQAANADSGTITLTVNGVTAATTQYAGGATPTSIASGLAAGVTAGSPVTVSAEGDSINLQAKQTGSTTDYSYSLQTTSYDSTDFSQPSFLSPAESGNLSGGASQNTSGGTVYSYSVSSYDGVGNLQGMTDSVMGVWTYQYDTLNRVALATDTQPNNPFKDYCWYYDAFGNRKNQEGATAPFESGSGGGSACTPGSGATVSPDWATYDTNNHLTGTPQVPAGPTYDAAGNITYDGVNSYLYDAEGRICAVSSTPVPGVSSMIGYVYNAEGERVGKGQITTWSCDPSANGYTPMNDYVRGLSGEELTELTANGGGMLWKNTNVYADGQLFATYDGAGLHFLLNDPLGSRRAQTNYAGVLEQTCASLPFGDGLNCSDSLDNPNSLHFTGKERDAESGLDYFGARYFGSSMGRFQSPDPSGMAFTSLSNPQSFNMYSYVQNNPLNSVDPDGLDCVYIGGDGSISGFNRGDCDNSTDAKANSGYYFDGTVNTIYTTTGDTSGQVVGVQGTTDAADSLYQANPAGLSFAQPNGNTSTSGMDTTINTSGDFSQTTQVNHGTHPFRDNNSGDIVSGGFVNGHGALGTDGRFGVFPSAGQGRAALDALLHSPAYSSLSVNAAVARYAPAFENNTAGYAQFLQSAVGVSGNTPLSSLSPSQMNALENGIAHYEGAAARGNYGVSVTTDVLP